MAAIYQVETQFHAGEQEMHRLMKVPESDNPTSPFLSPYAANMLNRSPLLALGTLDEQGRPWSTLWGGEIGFARAVAQSIIGVKTTVGRYDPVLEAIANGKWDGEMAKRDGTQGKMVSGLAIDLENRKRVKLFGRLVTASLLATTAGAGEVEVLVQIKQSLGNCPKYINKKHIINRTPTPQLISSSLPLLPAALDHLEQADLFFITTSNHDLDMDTNIRGGSAGFVRVIANSPNEVSLIWPDYSGNRLYQTLGNLRQNPLAGLVFPDFKTGNVLYLTGSAEVLIGKAASDVIEHTNLAVKFQVHALFFVASGLGFRSQPGIGEDSPYNPPIRFLKTESRLSLQESHNRHATLLSRTMLSPTIAQFHFSVSSIPKTTWKAGQYVTLAFEEELDHGYSHMRDDDPQSLNDDFLRTFTVSSKPSTNGNFEITIRKVGVVTDFLFRTNPRAGLEIPVRGFGGEFFIEQTQSSIPVPVDPSLSTSSKEDRVVFVASGVGITPLLAQLHQLLVNDLVFYWTIREADLGFVAHVVEKYPSLTPRTTLFITSSTSSKDSSPVPSSILATKYQRITGADLLLAQKPSRWYLCTGPKLRVELLEWLKGEDVYYEDFGY